jgi:hypothetical protein
MCLITISQPFLDHIVDGGVGGEIFNNQIITCVYWWSLMVNITLQFLSAK